MIISKLVCFSEETIKDNKTEKELYLKKIQNWQDR
jgi:hypothetical protein